MSDEEFSVMGFAKKETERKLRDLPDFITQSHLAEYAFAGLLIQSLTSFSYDKAPGLSIALIMVGLLGVVHGALTTLFSWRWHPVLQIINGLISLGFVLECGWLIIKIAMVYGLSTEWFF